MPPIRNLFLPLAISFCALTAAKAQSYTYTSVVDSTGALKGFDELFPSINNKGDVVFHATFPATTKEPSGEGIYVTDGSSYRGIAVTGGTYDDFLANPAINDNGLVGFQADLADGSEAVFIGDGKTMNNKTVATSNSGRLYQFSPVIRFSDYTVGLSGTGSLVFTANQQSTRALGLFAGTGSQQETQLFATTTGATGASLQPNSPATNASGQVVFYVVKGDGIHELRRTTVAGGLQSSSRRAPAAALSAASTPARSRSIMPEP